MLLLKIVVVVVVVVVKIVVVVVVALSALAGHFTDPELSRLASCLPSRCLGAKADSTTERYSRAFDMFRLWDASYNEISVLPSNYLSVAIYLQSNSSYSALEAALCGICCGPHNLYGFSDPCDSNLVQGILKSAKRSLSRPVVKKRACQSGDDS